MKTHLSNLKTLLPVSAAAWIGLASTVAASTYYVDLGPNNGLDGTTTPASGGNQWNNLTSGSNTTLLTDYSVSNLIDSTGNSSSISISATGVRANGYRNGGLLTPDSALLGEFAYSTATGDYFFSEFSTMTLTISGLTLGATYDLTLFATRTTDGDRNTLYTVTDDSGSSSLVLQTSGTGAGNAANPTGNNDDFAIFTGLTPNASGEITLTVTGNEGTQYGYLGAMSINETIPEPSSIGLAVLGGLLAFGRRRRA
ncbi:PEP-CTERM sorting domain-containing protein [Luteolibacter pohnpeiensis]|uniref:PEP-CTERM sorting domain-containing protein n=1 Tax=Luteolibacter pohnpeiensis TaxID=454153 RepID=A0A934SBI8_9BACT|nr:PEP-CTERM sorting domain-containing protein [Luteolibacter pohnpeiensis]MBK1882273.1 PEP-CTERM sorting domain-containing protein [Luteolibacter pohnpeiensis]